MAILTEGTILRERTDRGATIYWRVTEIRGQMIWGQPCKKDGSELKYRTAEWSLLTLSDLLSGTSRFEVV